MSELIKENDNRATIRWKLLTSVSAAALLVSVYSAGQALAADGDADRPSIWIELGGQLDRLGNSQEAFDPRFMGAVTIPGQISALNVQNPPLYGLDGNASISFQPKDSDWAFSASVQYGRAKMARHRHQQTANAAIPVDIALPPPLRTAIGRPYFKYGSYYPSQHVKFADGKSSESERHLILDFQAGKDVGLGMFGGHGSSVISAGVRFAQFSSKENVRLRAMPDLQYPTAPVTGTFFTFLPKRATYINMSVPAFHEYTGIASSERNFHGAGPLVDWKAFAPIAGNSESGELTVDWGANASLLFGRQKASGHHQTTKLTYDKAGWAGDNHPCNRGKADHQGTFGRVNGHFCDIHGYLGYTNAAASQHQYASGFNRARSIMVPNVGAFVGLSYRYSDAKLSFGYKADMFFGAIDGGIDTRKEENRAFYGPYASISIGLGD